MQESKDVLFDFSFVLIIFNNAFVSKTSEKSEDILEILSQNDSKPIYFIILGSQVINRLKNLF